MKNKRILMVGKETFTYPFYYLSMKWKKENTLGMFWTNPLETKYDECDINCSTYYEFKKLDYVQNYTLNEAANTYTNNLKNPDIDYNYLDEIEKKYTNYKKVNAQLISDQKMTAHCHFRTMCVPVDYEQQLYWIQLIYQSIEKMIYEFNPDVIFDCDIAELPRTVLNEVAYSKGIPYISISYPRYEMFKIPSFCLNLRPDLYFIKKYTDNLRTDNKEEVNYVLKFREKTSIKNEMYMIGNNPTYKYDAEPLTKVLSSIKCMVGYFLRQDKSQLNRRLKRDNPILFDRSGRYLKFWIRTRLFRYYLMKPNHMFEDPVEGEKYVYMPLHLIPESTTFSVAPFWINELNVIEAVSKSIPAGWRLYVKEHQAMLGERGKSFYDSVKKIPNVRLVRFNYYRDPKPWIINAQAVVTITGTAAYEAALLGKKAYIFGDTAFEMIKGITRITTVEELPKLFSEDQNVDNLKECAAYIKTVKEFGEKVNLGLIIDRAHNSLMNGEPLGEDFYSEVDNLERFFIKAYKLYNQNNTGKI